MGGGSNGGSGVLLVDVNDNGKRKNPSYQLHGKFFYGPTLVRIA